MTRLYSNENFPQPAVETLRELGHDVLTSFEAGQANQRIPDEDVVRFATEHRRAILTLNKQDFVDLHKSNKNHGGVIVCTVDNDFEALAGRVHAALQQHNPTAGKLISVEKTGFKLKP